MLFGMGPFELIVILVVVLVIFGPKNLPKLGKSLGKTVKGIREGMDAAQSESAGQTSEAADVVVENADADDADAVTSTTSGTTTSETAASNDTKFCPKCGAPNPAENHFCSKCGSKLN